MHKRYIVRICIDQYFPVCLRKVSQVRSKLYCFLQKQLCFTCHIIIMFPVLYVLLFVIICTLLPDHKLIMSSTDLVRLISQRMTAMHFIWLGLKLFHLLLGPPRLK